MAKITASVYTFHVPAIGAALDHLERVPLLGIVERAALLQHCLQLLQVTRGVVAGIAQCGDPGQFGRAGGQCQ